MYRYAWEVLFKYLLTVFLNLTESNNLKFISPHPFCCKTKTSDSTKKIKESHKKFCARVLAVPTFGESICNRPAFNGISISNIWRIRYKTQTLQQIIKFQDSIAFLPICSKHNYIGVPQLEPFRDLLSSLALNLQLRESSICYYINISRHPNGTPITSPGSLCFISKCLKKLYDFSLVSIPFSFGR